VADRKKDELVRFLEEHAFKPVLNARLKGATQGDIARLNPPGVDGQSGGF